jgi:hypothetical protein
MHQLEIVDGGASFVARRIPAWHRLGTVVDEWLGLDEALRLARADYEVRTVPLFAFDGRRNERCEDAYATVREVDGRLVPLGIVTGRYEVVQNREAFAVLEPLQQLGASVEMMGVLGRGERVFASVRMPFPVEVGGTDRHDFYGLVTTGHDGHHGVPRPDCRLLIHGSCAGISYATLSYAGLSHAGLSYAALRRLSGCQNLGAHSLQTVTPPPPRGSSTPRPWTCSASDSPARMRHDNTRRVVREHHQGSLFGPVTRAGVVGPVTRASRDR